MNSSIHSVAPQAVVPMPPVASGRGSPSAHGLKMGLFLTPWSEARKQSIPRWTDILALARAAETAGLDSIWISDHLLMRLPGEEARGSWEGWSLLAALAATVPRVEVGSLVLCTLWRNPALIAKMAATVDEISGGRLILGLGAGWHEPEFTSFGFPFDRVVARFEETLQIIHPLLRTGRVDFEGTHGQARRCELRPRGPRPTGPPLMVGALANRPRLLRLAAEYADIWNAWLAWGDSTPSAIPPLRSAVDEACERAARDPATLARAVTIQIDYPDATENRVGDAASLGGDAAFLAEQLNAFALEGINHLQVLLNPNSVASVERFAVALALLRA